LDPSCSSSAEVTLTADATDRDDEQFQVSYLWAVTGGRLNGKGRTVTWDLAGLSEGTYTATVEFNDGNQHTSSASIAVNVARCRDCVWRESRCPSVIVICPSGADSKKPVVFEAQVAGADPDVKARYTWSVTAGKIISGQGTSKIVVDASNLVGQSITATVTLGGFDPRCSEISTVAVCTVLQVKDEKE
jgi:hypothetical protein